MTASTILDLAIVGGGVSGLYSAWRLATSDRPLNIKVFESSDRIGGRLLSVPMPGAESIVCELGGMRYISNQDLTRSLVENVLHLEVEPLPASQPGNLCYLRGRRLRFSDLAQTDHIPYHLRGAEIGRDPGSLLLYALHQLLPGCDRMSADEFEHAYQTTIIDGRPLYDHGFWNLLLKVISNEAYNLIQDSSGYYSITTNWNAGDAIRMSLGDFAPNIQYKRISKGFETVPQELAARFKAAGGQIVLSTRLKSFDTVDLPDGQGIRMIMADSGGHEEAIFCRELVLAMPRRSLRLLEARGPLLSPGNSRFQHQLDAVEGISLFKIFVAYSNPWWEITNVSKGESTTDLPIRQCYYWGVEAEPGSGSSKTNAVLMASYNDVRETFFWRGLESSERFHLDSPGYSQQPMSTSVAPYLAPKAMVDEVQRQLKILHGVQAAPDPYCALYRDWDEDPFGGGVHFWNRGYNSTECIKAMIKPMDDLPVYVIGEAYSRTQGWVQGALETSEQMLQDHFALSAPDWVTSPPDSAA